jgi:hypothetical protein
MGDITKEELKGIVFVTAHNAGALTEEVQRQIDAFDFDAYERFLKLTLERRERADGTGEPGGGTRSAAYLRSALEHLEYILSH